MRTKPARKQPIMGKLISKEEGARTEEITTTTTVEESLEDLTKREEAPVEDPTEKKEVPVVKVKEAITTEDNLVLNHDQVIHPDLKANPTTAAKQEASQKK